MGWGGDIADRLVLFLILNWVERGGGGDISPSLHSLFMEEQIIGYYNASLFVQLGLGYL